MEEKKIGFVGDSASISFFKVLGAEVFSAYTQDEAAEILSGLPMDEYAMVFITEEVFDQKRFQRYMMEKKLLVLPSLKSGEGKGYFIVEELIRKATGMKG